jgi:hypothetical protein
LADDEHRVWIIAICTMIYAGGVFPAGYQANFPLRADLEPWQDEWPMHGPLRHPLYEIIRSPAAEKLPLTFPWCGYSNGPWNGHIHTRDLPRFSFPGGETLDLPAELTDADREYVKQAFWEQRCSAGGKRLGRSLARRSLCRSLSSSFYGWRGGSKSGSLARRRSRKPRDYPIRRQWSGCAISHLPSALSKFCSGSWSHS